MGRGKRCYLASLGGHLDVLQWAREHGCEWEKRDVKRAIGRAPRVCVAVSARARLHVGHMAMWNFLPDTAPQ